MTTTTFFIIFIPILSVLLLVVNLLLAPHNPYQEKDSVFECGFHSFLGQNRTQFSVSFFIFGLLFLLFDLEILLVYPYSVSSYTNDIYGLVIMIVFFILLTLGFIFELGKNALTIDSKQISLSNNSYVPNLDMFNNLIKSSLLNYSRLSLYNNVYKIVVSLIYLLFSYSLIFFLVIIICANILFCLWHMGIDIEIPHPRPIDDHVLIPLPLELSLLLLLTYGMLRWIGITIEAEVIVVKDNNNSYYIVIDKSDPLGLKLRLLYIGSSLVKGRYISLNGMRFYGIVQYDDGPISDDLVAHLLRCFNDPAWDDKPYYHLGLAFPHLVLWENLTTHFNLKIYNGYGLNRQQALPEPASTPNGWMLSPVYVYKSSMSQVAYFI